MLVRLLPEQISVQWDMIKPAILESLHSAHESIDTNETLTSLLNSSSQCWVSIRRNDGRDIIEGLAITMVTKNLFDKGKNLLIYGVYGYGLDNREAWESGFKTLAIFAKSEGCSRITGYSSVSSIIKLAERLGGDVSQRFISIPV